MAKGDISDFARALLRTDSLKVDDALREVREVLDEMIAIADNVAGLSADDEATIQRARVLYQRLIPAAQDAAGER